MSYLLIFNFIWADKFTICFDCHWNHSLWSFNKQIFVTQNCVLFEIWLLLHDWEILILQIFCISGDQSLIPDIEEVIFLLQVSVLSSNHSVSLKSSNCSQRLVVVVQLALTLYVFQLKQLHKVFSRCFACRRRVVFAIKFFFEFSLPLLLKSKSCP